MRKKLTKKEMALVIEKLLGMYPDAGPELDFTTPFELLIATILSAQCTDVRVNKVTSRLFAELKAPEDYITLGQIELEKRIRTCGLSNSKSNNIVNTCQIINERYGGVVPETIEELVTLPGVGRKTANVVASNAFGVPAIAVDTHVFRVSNRIGLAHSKTVEKTEEDLMKNIPKSMWTKAHHLLIFHGRRICKARKPGCEICPINTECLYYEREINNG